MYFNLYQTSNDYSPNTRIFYTIFSLFPSGRRLSDQPEFAWKVPGVGRKQRGSLFTVYISFCYLNFPPFPSIGQFSRGDFCSLVFYIQNWEVKLIRWSWWIKEVKSGFPHGVSAHTLGVNICPHPSLSLCTPTFSLYTPSWSLCAHTWSLCALGVFVDPIIVCEQPIRVCAYTIRVSAPT